MGWLVLIAFIPLRKALPPLSFSMMILGGLAYTMGFPFYAAKKAKWAHSVFHLFVLTASILHFFSVFFAFRAYISNLRQIFLQRKLGCQLVLSC